MPAERLQKLIAQAGIASRRAAEDLIRQNRVTVNGQPAAIGAKADPAVDEIRVDGELLKTTGEPLVYIMLNKPPGIVSAVSTQRQEERDAVTELVSIKERVYPVGRLDADSEGLILLTNDGDLTQRLTHPRYGHTKVYRVLVKGKPGEAQLTQWAEGVELEDGQTNPAEVRVVKEEDNATWLEIRMREGRKRQIRRTSAVLHLHVERLIRTHLGPLALGDLPVGDWRYLNDDEIAALKRLGGLGGKSGGGKSGGSSGGQSRRKSGGRPDRKPGGGKPGGRPGGKPGGKPGNRPSRPPRQPGRSKH